MKIDENKIRKIESVLTNTAEDHEAAHNLTAKERTRAYCQGIAFALEQIGYRVEWDNGKAYIVEDDSEV
ncbi:MAG: hypothetical protein J6Q65_05005 [Lentisphaeria bacterium]|nr:hypothetical protein [Lentisphaeria bacterium]